jgi:hypothetical protein
VGGGLKPRCCCCVLDEFELEVDPEFGNISDLNEPREPKLIPLPLTSDVPGGTGFPGGKTILDSSGPAWGRL